MPDIFDVTDSEELRALRHTVAGLDMPERPALDEITDRGRTRRRHKHYGAAVASVATVATGTVLAFALTGGATTTAPTTTTIRTAAYTLVSNADGTSTLTINANELFDPATLQSDLEREGIPAKVTVGSWCTSDPTPPGFHEVASFDPGSPPPGQPATVTIDPAALPAGAVLSISEIQLPRGLEWSGLGLVDGSSYTCDSTTPQDPPSGGIAFILVPPSQGDPSNG